MWLALIFWLTEGDEEQRETEEQEEAAPPSDVSVQSDVEAVDQEEGDPWDDESVDVTRRLHSDSDSYMYTCQRDFCWSAAISTEKTVQLNGSEH